MRTGKKLISMFMVFVMAFSLGSVLPTGVGRAIAAAYSAEDVKNAAQDVEWYIEKAGDDITSFLKNEFGYSDAVVKEALQTLIVKYGGYKKLVLTYKERTGVDFTKGLKKALGHLDKKGGKMSKMNVLSIEEQLYTGKALKPVPAVMDGGYQLKKSKDYTISYTNNKKIGTAIITIKGSGKYSGVIKKTFSIVGARKSEIPTISMDTPEIVGNDTILLWRVSSGGKNYDGVQILRADTEKGTYKVIKTLKGQNTNAGYIDKNTKKKSYYYKVRAYVETEGKNWSGAESKQKAEAARYDWYSNSDGYVRVYKNGEGTTYDITFDVYDLNLDLEWGCDWSNTYGEGEITYTPEGEGSESSKTVAVNYLLSPPYDYNGQSVEVGAYYDDQKFYYIWTQGDIGGSGSKSGFLRLYTAMK